jgi:putative zinc finger/helix-turn-helix YgiT family protein
MKAFKCPKGHGELKEKELQKKTTFRGVEVALRTKALVCPVCGLEAGTVPSAGLIQRALADEYRKKTGLLSGNEIRTLRKARGLSQDLLAERMGVGVASVKRWETGMIQTRSMDQALRTHLCDTLSGNRELSIPRIKLVIRAIEPALGRRLLKKNDKMLYAAKYLWYADMLAFRTLGKSMTGAAYAALPYGPQLNNYRDLIEEIMSADETNAEPLSGEELRIIERIVKKFPREQMAYDAAHREKVWKDRATGTLIPYSAASEIAQV